MKYPDPGPNVPAGAFPEDCGMETYYEEEEIENDC
jgi:hypothetical protein